VGKRPVTRVTERDKRRMRFLGEATARMDEEFPLPPATPADLAWIRADVNKARAEIGLPPLEERGDHERPVRTFED
jgi:hypothetical protein